MAFDQGREAQKVDGSVCIGSVSGGDLSDRLVVGRIDDAVRLA